MLIKLFNDQSQDALEEKVNLWLKDNYHLEIREIKYQGGEFNYKPYHHAIIVFE